MNEQTVQAHAEKRQRVKQYAMRTIFVRFQKGGIHKYPAAATDPLLATGDEYDVSFLATPHRHIFHFEVTIEVFHNDRDIEFIQFKRWLENQYSQNILALDYKSCEMMFRAFNSLGKLSTKNPFESETFNIEDYIKLLF